MYYLGLDLGSSSVKVALVEASSGRSIALLQEPSGDMKIKALKDDWAEQDPNEWWNHCCNGIKKIIQQSHIDQSKIIGVGISYQMHGLVVLDEQGNSLRDAIIWCDSRAVSIGEKAFDDLGEEKCMKHLLNAPGNFTASKLKWVRDNEPEVYGHIYKYMLPGDFIAYKLTGEINTTKNGLSEGMLWDYNEKKIANWLLNYYDIDTQLTPNIVDNFTVQGKTTKQASVDTGLPIGIPITYRSGDQPNNALSLNVFNAGEVAATGGTSGVMYAVTDNLLSKESTRINHFAHVNYTTEKPVIGKLLCINGAGIQYKWLRDNGPDIPYETMNYQADQIPIGSEGLVVLPFGNGSERMLNNTNLGAQYANLNFNKHTMAHLYRASLEGIAFSFVYGMELIKNDNAPINVIKAGNDNLFGSKLFSDTIATLIGHEIEIYNTTGAIGAARAAGLIDRDFEALKGNVTQNDYLMTFKPNKNVAPYQDVYKNWKETLESRLDIKK